jgi:hypothetical protein
VIHGKATRNSLQLKLHGTAKAIRKAARVCFFSGRYSNDGDATMKKYAYKIIVCNGAAPSEEDGLLSR